MTNLEIRLLRNGACGGFDGVGMARVRHLTNQDGSLVEKWWQKEDSVGAVNADTDKDRFTLFELPGGGMYEITIFLPDGREITCEYAVEEGSHRKESIPLLDGVRDISGGIPSVGVAPSDLQRRVVKGAQARGLPSDMLAFGLPPAATPRSGRRGPAAPATPEVYSLASSQVDWELLEDAINERNRKQFEPRLLPWRVEYDGKHASWFPEMPNRTEGSLLVENLEFEKNGDLEKYPRWVVFDTHGRLSLVSVPWAWWGGRKRHPGERICFDFDEQSSELSIREQLGHVNVTIEDFRWSGLLGFLASGRLNQARKIIDRVMESDGPEQALYDKRKSPLVAVAGGIILVACAESLENQKWDHWLENLANWFPSIPDGPIILGCRRAAQAKARGCLEGALHQIEEGISRGIPYFSASVRMANMTLARIGEELPEAEKIRRSLSLISSRLDPSQVFSIIKL